MIQVYNTGPYTSKPTWSSFAPVWREVGHTEPIISSLLNRLIENLFLTLLDEKLLNKRVFSGQTILFFLFFGFKNRRGTEFLRNFEVAELQAPG